ncbi:PEP-CTERM sorting domain-containing protein [Cellvibrio sp.]|uniref:PEP-CTERM sorting domain-containing protein n=1 Tax=Cellvibrio sp. TaxID=1965322 RepID=UPI0039648C28
MKLNSWKLLKSFAAVACIGAISISAAAKPVLTPPPAPTPAPTSLVSASVLCSASTTTTSLIYNPSYEGCLGAYQGNIDNQLGLIATTVNATPWASYFSSSYFSSESYSAAGNPFAQDEGANDDGYLNFDFALTGKFTLGIKQGNAFSLYFFDGSDISGGVSQIRIDSNGVKSSSSISYVISHAGFFGTPTAYEPPPPPPVKVPEPSSVLLFALGLFGLVLARRKAV